MLSLLYVNACEHVKHVGIHVRPDDIKRSQYKDMNYHHRQWFNIGHFISDLKQLNMPGSSGEPGDNGNLRIAICG